ncbi:competence protein CoiA family protein [Pseudomonas sp. CCC3.2]|uniref:competence protein CoiA family protein n=1 Tax=unclassified Pseudomonas TaxID=196821 RepID=UPI002AB561D7|nr:MULTISPECIES: competence protein CoiA family protein [unclassified Pseudomonas]MDY7562419.1 competence protein CoiA family protein [Pseudomonas sp. AB6]MEB0180283.1 competence protein CoiA family protein [Pseudomonas sp. CCC3.2]MEB0212374.1 competence protein CoiA family protein [Pseudomonas sp. AB6]
MTMFVALDQNARLIDIGKASRGLACDCTCVSCGEPVIARKGLIREHHFAHYSSKASCFIQRETLLHLYAKDVIRDALGLQLPSMPGVYPTSEDTSSWWDFERVEAEVPQPGFQPDLVAHLKDGTQLFIEVAVTSFVGEDKSLLIKESGIKTIELDLRELLHGIHAIPSDFARRYIIQRVEHKTWLYPQFSENVLQCIPTWLVHSPSAAPSVSQLAPKLHEHRFVIMGMWVSARILPSGSIAVRSWSFNPQIAELLKIWRNQLGGEYNPKYQNWIYSSVAREDILARLESMNGRS